jgi:hypothetical protein
MSRPCRAVYLVHSMLKTFLKAAGFSLALVWSAGASAQGLTAPKYSNEFLSIGVGGRALGMGNVQSAIVKDATAGYWNPAGLLKMHNKHNVMLMHSELFAGIVKNDFGTYATPLDSASALAVSVIRMGVDDIADTRRLKNEYGYIQYDSIKYFSIADYAFLLSYARKSNLIEGLSLGANAKIIYRNVGDFANAWGFGIDAGAQLERNNWQFGLMGRDITTTFNAWSNNMDEVKLIQDADSANKLTENSIEVTLPRLIAGVGRNFQVTDKFKVLAAVDLDFTFDGKRNVLLGSDFVSIDPHAGLELGYNKVLFVRGGVNNLQKFKDVHGKESWKVQPNFGVGVAHSGLTLDLALSRIADSSNLSSVIVSLGYVFN